jgi:inner membrane protein
VNAVTHSVFGAGALAGASLVLGAEPAWYAYPVAVLAALAPDLDNPRSKLGNGLSRMRNPLLNMLTRPLSWLLRIISFALFKTVGHRTLTHSLLGIGAFAALAWLLWRAMPGPGYGLFVALVSGYASHVLADALNIRGVPLLWPAGGTVRLFPGGMKSGGFVELVVAVVAVTVSGYLAYLVHPALQDQVVGWLSLPLVTLLH